MRNGKAKPFLKWAGGKSQLIEQFETFFPTELKKGEIDKYFEPFAGSGAVFFHIARNYTIKKAYLNDMNKELMICYRVIQKDVQKLIEILQEYSRSYLALDEDSRKKYYYEIRDRFNSKRDNKNGPRIAKNQILRAAQVIFLNRTCFNGLFRLNKKGEFNVPFGSYKRPAILNSENLLKAAELLQNVELSVSDFASIYKNVDDKSFVYFDPPYKPLSITSSFTSYYNNSFDDNEQRRLAEFYFKLDKKRAKLMLSNSDPQNTDPSDKFFEELYKGMNLYKVNAQRIINSKADKRGSINELVITNYQLNNF